MKAKSDKKSYFQVVLFFDYIPFISHLYMYALIPLCLSF